MVNPAPVPAAPQAPVVDELKVAAYFLMAFLPYQIIAYFVIVKFAIIVLPNWKQHESIH